jgi:hypothetical protein
MHNLHLFRKRDSVSSIETNGVTLQTDQSGTCEFEIDTDVNLEKPKNDSCVEKMEESNKEVDFSLVNPCHGCRVNEFNGKAYYFTNALGEPEKADRVGD